MNERDTLRLASRRAALHYSIREGDARAAARAAARVRVPGVRLSAQELAMARDTRMALGRALVAARMPRPAAVPHLEVVRELPRRGTPWKRIALAAAAILALIFLMLGPGGAPGGSPQGATTAEVIPDTTRPQLLAQISRGRTAPTTAPEIVAVAEPTAQPTPDPTTAPIAASAAPTTAASAAPTSGTGGASAAPGTGSGGTGTGTGTGGSGSGAGGGGIGIGTGPGIITVATPTPTATPRIPPPGYGRLTVIVLDSRTLRPLPDTCVAVGTSVCDGAHRTDANGRFSIDLPSTTDTTLWDMTFIKSGYRTTSRKITVLRGREVVFQVFLQRG
jgi:hypothetical protein